jgi:hypothetical protein
MFDQRNVTFVFAMLEKSQKIRGVDQSPQLWFYAVFRVRISFNADLFLV